MEQSKNKKVLLSIIGVAIIVMVLGGITYAFFNYTRTGEANTLATGQVKFNTTGTLLIDVANDVPQDANLSGTDLTNMKNSHKGTLTMSGHTTLDDGVVYRIYAVRGEDMTGKLRLNDENIKFQLTPNFTSGSNGFTVTNNYYEEPTNLSFDNEERVLLSTGRVKDTSQLTTVTYDYFMWIDGENTLISSTTKRATLAEGNPSLADTTSGNTVADRYMKNDSTLTQDVTIFPAKASQAGMTVYTTNEFSNGYYNIKIIVEAEDRVRRDTNIVKVLKKDLDTETTINFGNISSSTNGKGLYILPGTEDDDYPIYYYRGNVNTNNVIFGGFCWQIVRTTETGGTKMIYNGVATDNGTTCTNTTHADRILTSTSAFNTNYNSVADVGYMNNTRFTPTNAAGASGSIYGKDIEWDGNNYLVIEETANTASTNTTKDNDHHYSCGTSGTTTCSTVRYYYYDNYYITLSSGDLLADAIYKMTGNGDQATKTKNAGYNLNANNSTAKTAIDTWFRTNLTNEVDNTKTDYSVYLEDTVYCNDRSFKTIGSSDTYALSGWNPVGGNLSTYLYFGTFNRYNNSNWYSTTNVPTVKNSGVVPNIACPNETDRFTVSSTNGNGALTYPVGLLTADEIIMVGASGNSYTNNTTYYLYTGGYYWSLSPCGFNYYGYAVGFRVNSSGDLGVTNANSAFGLRPVVSLKLGTEFETGGEGTPTNPYVVKINNN